MRYLCSVDRNDTLIVDDTFSTIPGKEADIEFEIHHGLGKRSFSVWVTLTQVRSLIHQLEAAIDIQEATSAES